MRDYGADNVQAPGELRRERIAKKFIRAALLETQEALRQTKDDATTAALTAAYLHLDRALNFDS